MQLLQELFVEILFHQSSIDWLEVKWPQPSSLVERFTDLPIDRYITIVEGEGKWK